MFKTWNRGQVVNWTPLNTLCYWIFLFQMEYSTLPDPGLTSLLSRVATKITTSRSTRQVKQRYCENTCIFVNTGCPKNSVERKSRDRTPLAVPDSPQRICRDFSRHSCCDFSKKTFFFFFQHNHHPPKLYFYAQNIFRLKYLSSSKQQGSSRKFLSFAKDLSFAKKNNVFCKTQVINHYLNNFELNS